MPRPTLLFLLSAECVPLLRNTCHHTTRRQLPKSCLLLMCSTCEQWGGYIELSLLIYRYFMKSFHNLASGEWSCVYIRPLKAFNLMRTLEPLRHTSIRRWQRLNACWRTDGNSEKCSFPRALRHLSTLWATASLILSKIKCGTSYLSDLSQRNHKKLRVHWTLNWDFNGVYTWQEKEPCVTASHVFGLHEAWCSWNASRSEVGNLSGEILTSE